MIDWMLEHWFIEAVIIIAGSFLVSFIVSKAIACINGDS
jgi:hypothetical protein